jgi:hypothetical protein
MKFGRQRLKDICEAVGWKQPLTDLMLNKPCSIFVNVEEDKTGEFAPKNRVGKVKPIVVIEPKAEKTKPAFNDAIPF